MIISTPKQFGPLREVFSKVRREFHYRGGERSWSSEGEDRVLARFFGSRASGFYVDVGAHHPFRFSNTYFFYRLGWRGINIDAAPGSMVPFKKYRSRDINLEIGISDTEGTAKFHVFNEPALNTFDDESARLYSRPPWKVIKEIDVRIAPLASVLREHCDPAQKIDFFSVDVEGRDLTVLQSNDWQMFRPEVVLAESLVENLKLLEAHPVAKFMNSVGYVEYAKTVYTIFYVDRQVLAARDRVQW